MVRGLWWQRHERYFRYLCLRTQTAGNSSGWAACNYLNKQDHFICFVTEKAQSLWRDRNCLQFLKNPVREPNLPGMQWVPPIHSTYQHLISTYHSLKGRLRRKLAELFLELNMTLKCPDIKFWSDKKLLITCEPELKKSKRQTQCTWLPELLSGDFDLSFAAITKQSERKAQERKISNFCTDPISAIPSFGTELQ